jgi:hypothetical protein
VIIWRMGASSGPADTGGIGAARVFLSDARLALGVLNEVRHRSLRRTFGVSREQANLLTVVVALSATAAAYETAVRVIAAPFPMSGSDAAIGAYVVREVGLGIAGPAAREVPLVGTLVAVALIGRLALPELRRALRGIRAAEHRVRAQRMGVYGAAQRAAGQAREAA